MRKRDWVAAIILAVMVARALLDREGEVSPRRPPIPMPPTAEVPRPVAPNQPNAIPGRLPVVEREGLVVLEERDGRGFATGTAFPVNDEGVMVTAFHVIQGCGAVLLAVEEPAYRVVRVASVHPNADLAVLETGEATAGLTFATARPGVSDPGFHYGFPAGDPGAAASFLMGAGSLRTSGVRNTREPVLVWARQAIWPDGRESIAGASGGPTLDRTGAVIGVNVAEDARRGRFYTAAPESIAAIRPADAVDAAGPVTIDPDSWLTVEARLREAGLVRKVLCAPAGQRLQIGQVVRLVER